MRQKTLFAIISIFLLLCTAQICFALKIEKGPYLQDVALTAITVCWETDTPAPGKVYYAPALNKKQKFAPIEAAEKSRHHCTRLEKLNPSNIYTYWVEADGIKSKVYNFHTAKQKGEDSRLVVYGDSRSNEIVHRSVVQGIIAAKPDFVINTGDIVNKGEELPDWDMFFRVAGELMHTTPYYVALGNHEQNNENYFHYLAFPGNERWYSFDYAGSHFIVLDSNMPNCMDPEQMKWLKEDLKDHQDADFIFVTFHSPPYSSGKHGSDLNIRKLYSEIFEKNGVDVVFNGHNHDYERLVVGKVIYVVSGGGGATLYEVGRNEWTQYAASVYHFTVVNISGGKLTFEAKRPNGKTFDSFTLTSKRARQHSE